MRTEDQVKRKLNELKAQRSALQSSAGSERSGLHSERLEDMILLLEWVLNEPTGSYHNN